MPQNIFPVIYSIYKYKKIHYKNTKYSILYTHARTHTQNIYQYFNIYFSPCTKMHVLFIEDTAWQTEGVTNNFLHLWAPKAAFLFCRWQQLNPRTIKEQITTTHHSETTPEQHSGGDTPWRTCTQTQFTHQQPCFWTKRNTWMANALLKTVKNNLVETHPCGY